MRTSSLSRLLCISSLLWLAAPGSLSPALWAAPAVGAANLSGQVEFKGPLQLPPYRDNYYAYRPPTSVEPERTRVAVVYLEDLEGKLGASRARTGASIDQRNETFIPKMVAVQVGSRVEFPNSDSTYHNVFSFSKAKRFDLGRYPKGNSRSVVFNREGVVRVFCEIHSHMSAFVLVLSHPYFAMTDPSGHYRIENIPPGRYAVVAWNDEFRTERKEVILDGGEESRCDFVLQQTH